MRKMSNCNYYVIAFGIFLYIAIKIWGKRSYERRPLVTYLRKEKFSVIIMPSGALGDSVVTI